MNKQNFIKGLSAAHRSATLDRAGLIASCVCALHCALVPAAVAFLPMLGITLLANVMTDVLLITVAVIIGLFSLVPAFRQHHRRSLPLLLFACGVTLMLVAVALLHDFRIAESVMMVSGATLIGTSHFINRRLCRVCCAR